MVQKLVAAVLCVAPAFAGVYTIPVNPEQDVKWYHFYYFGADNGWNGPGSGDGASYYYDAPPAYRNHFGTYLGFDLPSLGSGETVLGAALYLNVTGFESFGESGITAELRDLGTLVAGTFVGWGAGTWLANIPEPSGVGWLGLDVTTAIQGAYGNSQTFQAFNINPYGSGIGYSGLSFLPATENGDGGPYLRILTDGGGDLGGEIPEPVTFVLLGTGLATIAAGRLRRARSQ